MHEVKVFKYFIINEGRPVFQIINLIFSSCILSLMEVTGEFLRVFFCYI